MGVAALVRAAIQAGASPEKAPANIDQKDAFSTWAKDAPTLARAVSKLKPLFASIDTTSVFATLLERGLDSNLEPTRFVRQPRPMRSCMSCVPSPTCLMGKEASVALTWPIYRLETWYEA